MKIIVVAALEKILCCCYILRNLLFIYGNGPAPNLEYTVYKKRKKCKKPKAEVCIVTLCIHTRGKAKSQIPKKQCLSPVKVSPKT